MKPISIIIPSYCPGQYIWKCIDSLAEQTLSKDLFEVVVVLNGCGEPYKTMLQQGIAERDGLSIRLIHTDEGGVSNARNIGIDATQSAFVCFIDDDDWVSPTYLEELYALADDDTIAVSNVIDYDEDTATLQDGYIGRAFKRVGERKTLTLRQGRSFMSSSCCKMIPRNLISDKHFDTRFRLGEDALFMASITARLSHIAVSSSEAVYYRRISSKSASRRKESRWNKTCYALRLSLAYARMYLRRPREYDATFFMTRIAACLLKIVKRTWI